MKTVDSKLFYWEETRTTYPNWFFAVLGALAIVVDFWFMLNTPLSSLQLEGKVLAIVGAVGLILLSSRLLEFGFVPRREVVRHYIRALPEVGKRG